MHSLLEEISRHHLPQPPATPAQLDQFEKRVGWKLDPDLRAFYLHCNGAELLEHPNSPYRFLPLAEIIRARVAMRGEDTDAWGPASWYVLCELTEGDRILLDVSQQQDGRYLLRDGWHEGFPNVEDCPQVAGSFSEFLEKALRSEGSKFWLQPQGGTAPA